MIEKIIDLLIETGNIEYNNIKIYEYGLKLFLKRLFHILIFIIIGYLFGNLGGGKWYLFWLHTFVFVNIQEDITPVLPAGVLLVLLL